MKKIQLGGHKNGSRIRGYVIVDDEDFERLNKYSWCLFSSSRHFINYASRGIRKNGKTKGVSMHRFILNAPKGMEVDHINGNGLDNRKENIRICSHAENMRNQKMRKNNISGLRGVCWDKKKKEWGANIYLNYKQIRLGSFSDMKDAALAYNEAAKKYHGAFACLNVLV